MDVDNLWTAVSGDGHLWALCGIALGLGALGGRAQSITSATDRATLEQAWWRRALVGAVAAVAVLYVTAPASGVALISGSVVAGYAGQALLDALGARAKLKVTEDQVAEARRTIVTKDAAVERATAAAAEAELLLRPPTADGAQPAALTARTEEARRVLRAARRDPNDRG